VEWFPWEVSDVKESLSEGSGFLYFSFGMRAGGDCAVKSTFGAMANDRDFGLMYVCGLAASRGQANWRLIGRRSLRRSAFHVSGVR
jgi:hypothetical protein